MFSNNLDALAIVAGDRQCRLRTDAGALRLARSVRGRLEPRRHRAARPRRALPVASLRPCLNEVLS